MQDILYLLFWFSTTTTSLESSDVLFKTCPLSYIILRATEIFVPLEIQQYRSSVPRKISLFERLMKKRTKKSSLGYQYNWSTEMQCFSLHLEE